VPGNYRFALSDCCQRSVTDDQVDIAAKQTTAGSGANAEGARSDAVADEFGRGDEALLFGRELAALYWVPEI
jgi:hypothetical protein